VLKASSLAVKNSNLLRLLLLISRAKIARLPL